MGPHTGKVNAAVIRLVLAGPGTPFCSSVWVEELQNSCASSSGVSSMPEC